MTLLQVPGGPELLVIALIFLVLVALVFGLVAGVTVLTRRGSSADEDGTRRLEELEQRVETLEAELRADSETDSSDDPERTDRHDEP